MDLDNRVSTVLDFTWSRDNEIFTSFVCVLIIYIVKLNRDFSKGNNFFSLFFVKLEWIVELNQ